MREYKAVPPSVPPLFLIDNRYAYFVNLNHPLITPEWQQFKRANNLAHSGSAASDEERLTFEIEIIKTYAQEYWDWWMKKAQYMIRAENREKGEILLNIAARCLNERKIDNAN